MSAALADALLDALDDAALDRLALLLAPRLEGRLVDRDDDRWLGARDAAAYLGLTVNALHKLTAARLIPFSQDAPGGKCWFLRSELDGWRRDGR